ncbi:MAG: hypothetical protein AAFP20_12040 [Cyanobacteria bacterium J06614_10]
MTTRLHKTSTLKKLSFSTSVITLALSTLTGCVAPGDSRIFNPTTPPGIPLPPSSVRDRVLETAEQDLGIPSSELGTLRVNEETWPDGCLGIGQADEGCLQALVDGWQVEIVHGNESWFYRTDSTGESVRQSYLENNLPPSLSELILAQAVRDTGIRKERLEIIRAEPRVWDGCLGIRDAEANCGQVRYYGWRVTLQSENRLLVYHTEMLGYQIRLNSLQNAGQSQETQGQRI